MATAIGIWLLRRRRTAAGLAPTHYRASNAAIVLNLGSCVFRIIIPWIPPKKGHADVSFWYATCVFLLPSNKLIDLRNTFFSYLVVGIAILLACGLYYYVWIVLIPKWGGYEIVEAVEELDGGARLAKLVKKYHHKHHSREHTRSPHYTPSSAEHQPLLHN